MPKRLNAQMDDERVRRLYHVLVDEDLSFTEWLRRQIDHYLAEKEPLTSKRGGGRPKEGKRGERSLRRGGAGDKRGK